MTSKERVKAAIAGEPVDRIPLGFYAVDCDTVARVIGRRTYVRDKIGAQIAFWEGYRDEVVESYQRDTVEFYQKLDCADLITFKEAPVVPPAGYRPERPPRQRDAETWEDRDGRIFKVSHLSNDLVCVHDPTEPDPDSFTEEQFPNYDPASYRASDPSIFEACDYLIEHLGATRYIMGLAPARAGFAQLGSRTTGMMLYALKPEVVRAANRRFLAMDLADDQDYLRPGQDGVLWEQDTGGTGGPLLRPAQYRELCLPFVKERVAALKGRGMQVATHNCGNNLPLMDMLLEAGIECYQSLQTNSGMELGYLTERWGKQLSFWGGVPVELLVGGTPEEVRAAVREAMEKGVRGRGFILGPSHSIAYGTKYDNFMAMLDEHQRRADRVAP
jgi:hypothetical protein